jgi:hypothetical protein
MTAKHTAVQRSASNKSQHSGQHRDGRENLLRGRQGGPPSLRAALPSGSPRRPGCLTPGPPALGKPLPLPPPPQGEELTWDYACVTEKEAEVHAAVCLCGAAACRGSFLSLVNAGPYQQVRWAPPAEAASCPRSTPGPTSRCVGRSSRPGWELQLCRCSNSAHPEGVAASVLSSWEVRAALRCTELHRAEPGAARR